MYRFYDLILAMSLGWAFYGIMNILKNKNNKEYNKIYALTLIIAFTIPIFDHLIKPTPKNIEHIYPILLITRNIYFTIGPLIFFYTTSLLNSKPIKISFTILHSLPFLLWLILSIIFWDTPLLNNSHGVRAIRIKDINILRMLCSSLSAIIYGLISLKALRKHKIDGQLFYSDKKIKHTLSWLTILILFMTLSYSLNFIYEPIKIIFRITILRNPALILTITPVIFLFLFCFFATNQSSPKDVKTGFNPRKYKKSSLGEEEIKQIYNELLLIVSEKKLYLNPELTLEDISLELKISKHKISQIINMKTDNNFYHFINEYRVKEFQITIQELKYPLYKIVDIAFQCGFNSSSVFYSSFKKIVNKTPKEYIKIIQN